MALYDIGINIRDKLRAVITDPINRTGGQWIHYESPINIGKTPCVYIEMLPSDRVVRNPGTGEDVMFLSYRIFAFISINDRGYISGTAYNGTHMLDKIIFDIKECLETNNVATGSAIAVLQFERISGHITIGNSKISAYMDYVVEEAN